MRAYYVTVKRLGMMPAWTHGGVTVIHIQTVCPHLYNG